MSEQPGTQIQVFVPDWLARELLKEANESAEKANVTREMSVGEYITSILVWRHMEKDPEFNEGIKEGEADIKAGRFYRLNPVTREWVPNPDWPRDGPRPSKGHSLGFQSGLPRDPL